MRVLLGLGGNTGDVAATMRHAIASLTSRVSVAAVSGLWRTAPVGPPQPDFLNAVALLEMNVPPLRLLAHLHDLEVSAGRDRLVETRWGPRPLDLDILLAAHLVIESPPLTVPHPRLADRRFVLLPACEIAPAWVHPRRQRTLADLLASLDPGDQPCARVASPRWARR